MKKEIFDYTLVPLGLCLMVSYHVWLLYRVITQPTKTVIGINAINRRIWVKTMMEDTSKNGVLAVQTLRNNIMASTLLASTAIMLSSLIAVLMTNKNNNQSSSGFVFGDQSPLGFSIKFFSILLYFFISIFKMKMSSTNSTTHLTPNYVGRALNKGSYFWSLGLRAFYFSFPLFLWIFGPIPMFCSCIFLVCMLYFLDITFEFGLAVGNADDEEYDEEVAV
ncbi:hypothetical protein MKW92_014004 [Papaver armeniacum]|nr:hypothetical protein MKW92_014004 [Papaver armeniacum]